MGPGILPETTVGKNTIRFAICICQLKLYRAKRKRFVNMVQNCRHILWAKASIYICVEYVSGFLSNLVPGLRSEQVLPLVQPQYGSLDAMQFLHNTQHTQFVNVFTEDNIDLLYNKYRKQNWRTEIMVYRYWKRERNRHDSDIQLWSHIFSYLSLQLFKVTFLKP